MENNRLFFKIGFGVLCVIAGFFYFGNTTRAPEMETKMVTVNHYIQKNQGGGRSSRSDIAVKFGTLEYKRPFYVEKSAIRNVAWQNFLNLQSGDRLKIKFDKHHAAKLNDASAGDIALYGIEKNGMIIFNEGQYIASREEYLTLWRNVCLIFGSFLIISGMLSLRKKHKKKIKLKDKNRKSHS